MVDKKSTAWCIVCHFVQWQKNNFLHRVTGKSLFNAVFGTDPNQGLQSTNLPQNGIFNLSTETI